VQTMRTAESNVHGVGAQLLIFQLRSFVVFKSREGHDLETIERIGLVVDESQAHQNNDNVLVFEWNIANLLFVAAVLITLVLLVASDSSNPFLFLHIKSDANLTVVEETGDGCVSVDHFTQRHSLPAWRRPSIGGPCWNGKWSSCWFRLHCLRLINLLGSSIICEHEGMLSQVPNVEEKKQVGVEDKK